MKSLEKRLIICGNGFDLHHRLKTSYKDYHEFLVEFYPQVAQDYDNFSGLIDSGQGHWHNIEESLEIDYLSYFEEIVSAYYPDIIHNESNSRWYDIEINLENEIEFIKMFTGKCFYEFLYKASSVNVQRSPIVEQFIDHKSEFITFNYTSTLESVYNIPTNRILYLHGALNKTEMIIDPPLTPDISRCSTMEEIEVIKIPDTNLLNNEFVRTALQFGAVGITPEQVKKDLYKIYSHDDFFGVSIEPSIEKLIDFVNMSTKKLQKNIPILKKFISNKEYDEVVIMGHSLLSADEIYYKEVLIPRLYKAQ